MPGSRALSVFDLDNTLLRGNSSFRFYFYLFSSGFYPFWSLFHSSLYYLRHRFFKMSLFDLHEKAFQRFLKGMDQAVLEEYAHRFWEKYFEKMIYEPAVRALKAAQEKRHYTMILSNTPEFLVSFVAKKLEIDEWCGARYDLDQDHRLEKIASLMHGSEKAEYVHHVVRRMSIETKDVTAYSDSITDLPLLESAGRAVCVNPDRRLLKCSKERGWSILS